MEFDPGSGELVVRGRAELLRRAFDNVLRNAVRHTAEDSAVEVELRRDPASAVVVRICDQGAGVAEADLAAGRADVIAFGSSFLANPDLPEIDDYYEPFTFD